MHGGTRTRDKGGGHPVETGLYSKYLRGEYRADAAAAKLGELDEEIRVARAYLAGAIRKHQAEPNGGYHISSGPVAKVRLHADVVQDFIDKIRKLELARKELIAHGTPPEDGNGLEDYRTWLASVGAGSTPQASHSTCSSASAGSPAGPPPPIQPKDPPA